MRLKFSKRTYAMAVTAVIVGTITGVVALSQPDKTHADDSPLVTQVDNHDKELANHEARITNTENDVKDLQDKTGTSSTTRVEVPVYVPTTTQSNTQPSPAPSQPVTVSKSAYTVGGQYDGYCALTYTDGSVGYVKATLTTENLPGGYQSSSDNCQSFVGQAK